jgi:hypothetical protein
VKAVDLKKPPSCFSRSGWWQTLCGLDAANQGFGWSSDPEKVGCDGCRARIAKGEHELRGPDRYLKPSDLAALTADRRLELEDLIDGMERASATFYRTAVGLGNHPFIEFTGFMNEYIKLCKDALKAGVDFTDCSAHTGEELPMADYNARYIGEKFNCIFGVTMMQDKKLWTAFQAGMKAG